MPVRIAYIGLVLIWSTTPLAIQWSSPNSPTFALAMRMVIGLICCLAFLWVRGIKPPMDKKYWPIYCVTGLSVFLAMTFVYLSAQSLPSGWISVLHGLNPIFTGIFAYFYLTESTMSKSKILGILLGLFGLMLIFSSSLELNESAILGIFYCLFAVLVTGMCSVFIKRLNKNAKLSGLEINVGGLTITAPLCCVTWLIFSDPFVPVMTWKSALSITYLGAIATTFGFTLYYYLLKNIEATQVSLVTLITPVTALILGSWLNGEPIVANVWFGAILICIGLTFFELGGKARWQQLKKYWRNL